MHQLDDTIFRADLEEILVELEPGVVRLVLFPLEEVLLLCADGAVLQTLGIIPREYELDG